jgi:hypothetical protein
MTLIQREIIDMNFINAKIDLKENSKVSENFQVRMRLLVHQLMKRRKKQ